jgi:hypothetical protein
MIASSYPIFVNTNGVPYPTPYQPNGPMVGAYYSGPMNVLENARLCALQPNISQVVLTQISTTGPWILNEVTGNIENPGNIYPIGQSTVTYTICVNGSPAICSTGVITINIVN